MEPSGRTSCHSGPGQRSESGGPSRTIRVGRPSRPSRTIRVGGQGGRLAEEVEVVDAGPVRGVDGAAAHGAGGGVEAGGGVAALEHVPVGLHDLAEEERVVHHVGHVHLAVGGYAAREAVASLWAVEAVASL